MTKDEKDGSDFYDRMVVGVALCFGVQLAKELFGRSYGNYRRHAEVPTVWRWLASGVKGGAKRSASAIKKWDPDPDDWEYDILE